MSPARSAHGTAASASGRKAANGSPPRPLAAQLAYWNTQLAGCSGTLEFPAHAAFFAQAARTPENIALAGLDGTCTYGELAARSNRLVQKQRAAGLRPAISWPFMRTAAPRSSGPCSARCKTARLF